MAKRIFSGGAVAGVAMAAVLLVCAQGRAQVVASDQTAGFIVYPKIVVDNDDIFGQSRNVDTLVQLTNTSKTACRAVHCYYVDGTSHCSTNTNSADPGVGACRTNADCDLGGVCLQGWQPGNFTLYLSAGQAVGWSASTGGTVPLEAVCTQAPPGNTQTIPPVREHYFTGELKCIEVDAADRANLVPINANDLKGEATTYEVEPGPVGRVDVRAYNAIGIQSRLSDGSTQNDQVMCLGVTQGSTECAPGGANQPEYASCPAVLILDHWFDGAVVNPPVGDGQLVKFVTTDLTLVPCSEDFSSQAPPPVTTTVQFLVYNEFEQRFSASTRVSCFTEEQLSRLDAPNSPASSIFNVSVQGTLTGQTRIRPVLGSETNVGHGLLGVAEEFNSVNGTVLGSAAYNLNYSGSNQTAGKEKGDFVRVGP
jgi:hypothetical protein